MSSINAFHMTATNRPYLIQKIEKLDPSVVWTVTAKPRKSKRSIEQNERYWQLLTDFGHYLGYSKDEMHDLVRFKFLLNLVLVGDEPMPLMKSTTKLTTAEMAELQENVERWAASLGFVWEETD